MRKYKCKHCGEYSETSIKLPIGRFCTFEHATDWATAKQEAEYKKLVTKKNKEASQKKKEERAKLKRRKENLKTKPQLIKEAQAAVNAYVRARDSNKPCISCQVKTIQKRGGTMDAGHYRSRGSAGHLRFNVLNIHSQCVTCNRWQSGNVVDYRINLIKRIGIDLVEKLESDNSTRIFTIEYLRRIKKIFTKRAKWYRDKRERELD